jgi:hypothetical protein
MQVRNFRKLAVLGGSIGSGLVALPASAALDITAVTSAVTEAATAVGTIGAAVLVLMVGAKVYKWIRAAM